MTGGDPDLALRLPGFPESLPTPSPSRATVVMTVVAGAPLRLLRTVPSRGAPFL